MTLAGLKDHLISAAAAAALLGGGATLVSTKVNDAVQDQRLIKLEVLNDNLDALRGDIADLRVELAKKDTNARD